MTRRSVPHLLEHARELITSGELAGALSPLLAAWRTTRAVAIAELIDRVSDRLPDPDPIDAPTQHERTARFVACANDGRSIDIGRLLATPWPMRWRSALPMLEALIALPHDPRIARALVGLVDAAPFDSTTSHRFWNPLVAHLGELRDERTLRTLERGREHGPLYGYRIRGLDDAIRKVSAPRPALTEPAQAALAAIQGLFAAEVATPARSEAELLGAVHANPDDDGARMVYADWLTERGDVRGELITLQLARYHGRTDAAMRRREAALLDEHLVDWLGPLVHVVDPRRCEFERGFLARARLEVHRTARLLDEHRDPRWATVHTLDTRVTCGPPELLAGLLHLRDT